MRGLFTDEIKVILKSFKLGQDDSETEEVKDAFDWFIAEIKNEKSTRIQRLDSLNFQRGKIYVFNYVPLTRDRLSYWDEKPIFLFFDLVKTKGGPLFMGLNLSWFPITARKFFLNAVKKMYKSQYNSANIKPYSALKQLPVNLDIELFIKIFSKIGFLFGIRTYKPTQIKGPIYSICFEDWSMIENISKNSIFPQLKAHGSLPDIYKEFKDHIAKNS